MCGICGVAATEPGQTTGQSSRPSSTRLHHRGPDARGCFAGRRARDRPEPPGDHRPRHRRPADHERGPHGRGRSQRRDLQLPRAARRAAARRATSSAREGDTEVIAHLAEELPPVELARRLDGMFAFAVWDERRGRLVLGRDRVGKKPLYYWHGGGRLVFGSEIKAVLADPERAAAARPRRDPGLPHLRLRPDAAHVLRRASAASRPATCSRSSRAASRSSSATGSRRSWPGTAVGRLDARSTDAAREVRALLRERRRAPADLRRPARRLPQRRHRLERGRRAHGRADGPARSRRSRSASTTATASTSGRTQRRSPSGTAPTTTSSWSIPTPWTWSSGSSGTTTSRSATRARSPPSCSAR